MCRQSRSASCITARENRGVPIRNIARIDEFAAAAAILGCDALTAQQYGRIKNDLRAKVRVIPENDIWIGAVGMQHDLTVVTRDHDHFSEISGLRVEVW